MKKIGIYGGSFSPPHIGHVCAARQFIDALSLDELFIVPSFISPHKQNKLTATPTDRYEMTKRAFKGISGVTVSDYEIAKKEVSYTVNTLTHFAAKGELYFLCGADMFLSLDKWYRPDLLFKQAAFVVIRREEGFEDDILQAKKHYEETYHATVIYLENKILPLSSTMIRSAVCEGRSISPWVNPEVEVYIREHRLYL